ncbi:MAG: hypothetical protein GX663_01670 [Clostridiales bacterium]|nr:hypothetical protein [Clostridiales bacterium]
MSKSKKWQHQKEFDTQTLMPEPGMMDDVKTNTHHADDDSLKELSDFQKQEIDDSDTQLYEPRPLTPDDDIYDDIIERFENTPTKPKYWFEELGDYWSCSCGHINKGDVCRNCGLERELLRSLFVLHKPASAKGKLRKKLKDSNISVADSECKGANASEAETSNQETSGQEAPRQESSKRDVQEEDVPSTKNTKSKPSETESSGTKTSEAENPPAVLPQPTKDTSSQNKPAGSFAKRHKVLLISIAVALVLLACGGVAFYYYMAAPAMQYQEAQKLQKNGQYEKAIDKYQALGNYKDSAKRIWQCYYQMGDALCKAGEYEKALKAYEEAQNKEKTTKVTNKIWKCYVAWGDKYQTDGDYMKAIETHLIAREIKITDELDEKINASKLAYVKTYQKDRTTQVETFMAELLKIGYSNIREIYDAYYAWHVKIIANTGEDDYSSDVSTFSRKDTTYFHVMLSGGEPSETIQVYYEITWPNGSDQIGNVDSSWKDGSKFTAGFQYPIPLFGKEGALTFKLYDENSNELLGTHSVTLQK